MDSPNRRSVAAICIIAVLICVDVQLGSPMHSFLSNTWFETMTTKTAINFESNSTFADYSSLNNTITLAAAAPYCPIHDLKYGRWIHATYDSPPFIPLLASNPSHSRTCPDLQPNSTFHTWEWEPNAVKDTGCTYTDFSLETYCRVMANRTLAIIGDSISFDHYVSLSHLLGVPQRQPLARDRTALRTSYVCDNTSLLVGQKDFFLNEVEEIVDKYFPDVMVLNRGAHYQPDDQLLGHMENIVFPQLRSWQGRCQQQKKRCILVWRTTVPGHPNCFNYSEPSTSLAEMEKLVHQKPIDGYNWHLFSHQNELVLNAYQ
jgi:hypothetical protein